MPTSLQSDVIDRLPSSDEFVSSLSRSSIQFPRGSNFRRVLPSLRTEIPCNMRLWRGTAERHVGGSFAPIIVDYAVELDNTIYRQRGTGSILLSPYISPTLVSPQDGGHGLLSHTSLFASPQFASFGSSLYSRCTQEHLIEPTNSFYPAPPQVSCGIEDMRNGNIAVRDRNPPLLPNDLLTRMATLPLSQVAATLSPTPSLSDSDDSIYSSPSPVTPVDHNVVEEAEEEEPRHTRLAPSSLTGSIKRAAGGRSAPTAKKRSGSSAKSASLSRPTASAGRYPCDVPGCKQVCKTQGDLKRHQSVLSHSLPSWKCSRCNYRFTREDALKRHTRNVPKCANAKIGPRGRATSIKVHHPEVASEVEAV